MTMKEYLAATGVRQNWIAQQIGVKPDSMSLYVNGKRMPPADKQLRIQEITKGKVRMGYDWRNGKSSGESR